MKFTSLDAFQKHIVESGKNHLLPVYIIVAKGESERKHLLEGLCRLFSKGADFKKCQSLPEALTQVQNASLFQDKVGALFDGIEGLLKGEKEALTSYLSHPAPHSHLVLGASGTKGISDLYKAGKKEMVLLDLSAEKPWDERARIERWLFQAARSKKKELAPDAAPALLDRLPLDRILLSNELEKLATFVGDRATITRKDVETLSAFALEENPFKVADSLVWEGAFPSLSKDPAFLLPLILQVRSQLELGLLLSAGMDREHALERYPRLRPKQLEQRALSSKHLGEAFFLARLSDLFHFELGIKTGQGRPDILFAQFASKAESR